MKKHELTKEEVEHVAKLAHLDLTPQEAEKFKKQLSAVVSYIDDLNEVDTSNVEPTSQTTGLENVARVDKVDASNILTQKEALSGTDKGDGRYFEVPIILTERTV